MGLGLMTRKAQLCEDKNVIDDEGFNRKETAVLSNFRVYADGKHGSKHWVNLAAFSEATELFRFRKIPNVEVTTKQYILFNGKRYDILSVENIKGRGMYLEVLAKKVETSNG